MLEKNIRWQLKNVYMHLNNTEIHLKHALKVEKSQQTPESELPLKAKLLSNREYSLPLIKALPC